MITMYLYKDYLLKIWLNTSDTLSTTSSKLEASAQGAIEKTRGNLIQENKKLKNELEALAFVRVNNLALLSENAELKHLLNAKDLIENSLLARVYDAMRVPIPSSIRLVSTKNINLTGRLYAFDTTGFIVGNVTKASDYNYTLHLFSEPDRSIKGFLRFEEGAPSKKLSVDVLALGSGSYMFFANKEYPVKKDQILYFKTYPMAIVYKVEKTPQSPFLKVYARLPFDLSLLDYVLIKGI